MFNFDISPIDSAVSVAIISACVSIFIFFVGKFLDGYFFYNYKMNSDHKYEQRKKIKERISANRIKILDSAESLNYRLWNFTSNSEEGWQSINEGEDVREKYYLYSFCYRFIAFLSWCNKAEKELVYLDSTLSDENDLSFVKYLKLMQNIFSDAGMFEGLSYDKTHAKDHFFKDDLVSICHLLIKENGDIMNYSEFKEIDCRKIKIVIDYLSAVSLSKSCNKWYMINSFHLVLISFLTRFGYDYQMTETKDINKLKNYWSRNPTFKNIKYAIGKFKLDKNKEIKKIFNSID